MLSESELRHIYPVIATPSHDGKYFHNYVLSLLNLIHRAGLAGMPLQVMLQRGESLITRARNNCVADFLARPEWTHLFWIDSDIGFSPEAAMRLLAADRDVTAGVYPLKRENWPEQGLPSDMTQEEFETAYTRYTVNAEPQEGSKSVNLRIDAEGFMEVEEAPTGFMVIKRGVFERMMAEYPELQYVSDSDYSEENGLHYRFFDCLVEPESRRYLSEDYGFCYLWRQIGGKVFVDAQSNLTHQGAKIYRGPFARSLQTRLTHAVAAPEGCSMRLVCEGGVLNMNPRGAE